jgi:hypothetical protein
MRLLREEPRRMPFRLVLAVSLVLLAGCKSPEEKLVDRRHDLREAFDELYADYAKASGGKAAEGGEASERGGGGVVGRLFAEIDRTHFEEACLAVGRGERPFLLSERLAAFLQDRAGDCREAFEIQTDVAKLEREVVRP